VVLEFTVDGEKMCASPGEGGDTVVYSGDVSSVIKRAKQKVANPWMLVRFCEKYPVATILYGEQGCLDFICDQLHDLNLRLDHETTDELVKKMRTQTHTDRWPLLHHMVHRECYVFRPLCHARDRDLMGHVSSARLLDAVLAPDADAEAAAIAHVRTHYNGAYSDMAKKSPDKKMCPSTRERLHGLSCSPEPGKIRLPTKQRSHVTPTTSGSHYGHQGSHGNSASGPARASRSSEEEEEERRQLRMRKNRENAYLSRIRKKQQMENLESACRILAKENTNLNVFVQRLAAENFLLRDHLKEVCRQAKVQVPDVPNVLEEVSRGTDVEGGGDVGNRPWVAVDGAAGMVTEPLYLGASQSQQRAPPATKTTEKRPRP